MVFVFVLEVIFIGLGIVMFYINKNLLKSKQNLKRVFTVTGIISVFVGSNMLFAKEPAFLIHSHPHANINFELSRADKLVQSKEKSDMTYKQLMQHMDEAYRMMQSGIMNQNTELVKRGAWMIQNHPAPKNKPWSIVKNEDIEVFKETLIAYDDLLHKSAKDIDEILKKKDWTLINEKAYEMSNHCVSCHNVWKDNLK